MLITKPVTLITHILKCVPSFWLGFSLSPLLCIPGLCTCAYPWVSSISLNLRERFLSPLRSMLLFDRLGKFYCIPKLHRIMTCVKSANTWTLLFPRQWFGEISLCIPGLHHTMTCVKSANAWALAFPRSGKFNCAYLDSTISWQGIKSVNTQSLPFPRYWPY